MRRTRHDVFAARSQPHYVVLWDLQWRVVECALIAAGGDLRQSLASAIERMQADGWRPEGAPDYGFVFLSRGCERRLLALTERHPSDDRLHGFDPHRAAKASGNVDSNNGRP
jgi:hypothetical protein